MHNLRRFALLCPILAGLSPGSVGAETWQVLSGAQIDAALNGRALVYVDRADPDRLVDTTQDFRASGRTLYTYKGRESWGYWRVQGDQYCSQWPPNDLWACYDMERQGVRIRFVGQGGDITEAVYAE